MGIKIILGLVNSNPAGDRGSQKRSKCNRMIEIFQFSWAKWKFAEELRFLARKRNNFEY